MSTLLTLPHAPQGPLAAVRAKALVFEDPASRALLDRADRVADSEAPVLITGPTGTGKELLDRHVHQRSRRRGPFVAVNCGAFTPGLVEAELFGHEAGAYTGAQRSGSGWFEAAEGGTLFLDEIGELPLPMQVKLLRVLQERQVVRVGSRSAVNVDVRIVAATHVPLEEAVARGEFRRDLYYRLNVAQLALAPLVERPLDIPPLAQHFFVRYAQRLGIAEPRLAPDALQALLAHPWPGNIRELENVIHCALILQRRGTLHAADLALPPAWQAAAAAALAGPPQLRAVAGTQVKPATPEAPALEPEPQPEPDPLAALAEAVRALLASGRPGLLQAMERCIITLAFEHTGRNQVHTARLLDVTRNALRTQLKRFGLLPLTAGR